MPNRRGLYGAIGAALIAAIVLGLRDIARDLIKIWRK